MFLHFQSINPEYYNPWRIYGSPSPIGLFLRLANIRIEKEYNHESPHISHTVSLRRYRQYYRQWCKTSWMKDPVDKKDYARPHRPEYPQQLHQDHNGQSDYPHQSQFDLREKDPVPNRPEQELHHR